MFWQFIYNALAVPAMFVGFHAAGYYAPKIREGIRGRRGVFEQLETQLRSARNLKHTAWFHFTSVGEFEQAKPLIEAIYAETRTVLTFFSPSVAPNVSRYRTPMPPFISVRYACKRGTSDSTYRAFCHRVFQIRYLAQSGVEGSRMQRSHCRRGGDVARQIEAALSLREAIF